MPIGFETGSVGGGIGNRPADLDGLADAWDRLRDRGAEILQPVFDWVGRVVGAFRWVLETVAELFPIQWYSFATAGDERTCPECGALDGYEWSEETPGPSVPVHNNCRCEVIAHRTEWRTRYVERWRQRWFEEVAWSWERVGWA